MPTTTYASSSQWVREVTDTGLIRTFPNSNTLGSPMRSAANVVGHFSLLVSAVGVIAFTTLKSVLGSDNLLASAPAIIGAWCLMAFVGTGLVKTSYRFAGYGLGYVGGLFAALAAGARFFDDGVSFGTAYLSVTGALGFVAWVRWVNIHWRGRYDA